MRARLLGSWSRPLAGSLVGLALAAGACAADDPVDRSGSSPPGLDGDGASDEGSPGDPSEVGEAVSAEVTVLAEGLVNPVGLALLPDGGVLVAEEGTGEDDASAGVSLLTLDGRVGRVITGLPSSVDSGDLSGVPFVGVDPAGERVLLSFFGAERLLTLPLTGSPPVPGEPVGIDALDSAMTPLNNVRLTNPFDITFAGDGTPVVSDASQNGVATENPDGTTRFIHRFADLRDPADPALEIDPVPTGIERVGDEYYVTLTGGCPFPARSGRLVAIDGERGERTVADGLDMPIDVARGPDGTVWVLEFARFAPGSSCFTGEGYESGTGRLSRLDASGALEEVLDGLDFPGSVLPLADGTVLVTEVFAGRLLQVVPDGQSPLLAAVAEPVEASAAWQLVDVAADVGLDFVHGSFAESVSMDPVAAMGGGLCWIDHDGDDRLDLYLVNSHAESEEDLWNGRGGLPTNALYRNAGGRFVDVSVATGTDLAVRGNGCVAADFNLDGAIDIYVTADGPNSLLLNRGDGTFVERGGDAGVAAEEWSTAAVVGDVNRDGLPDLFVASYIDLALTIPHPSGAFPQDYVGLTDHLFLNQGVDADGLPRFVDVAADVGLTDPGRGLGALLSDFDRDGDLDLYVTNDGNPNRLYRNDPVGDGPGVRFVDVTGSAAVGDSGSGMGVAGGDFDGDSTFDLVVTNWDRELNAVYTNVTDDELSFQYMTFRLGIS
ncbi:MAG: ScyD/ScyE family protein, partial [Acidimicrobiales bacterium]